MLSNKKCKEILDDNQQQKSYSLEEVNAIRDILIKLSMIDLEKFREISNDERNNLHKGIDRRAS